MEKLLTSHLVIRKNLLQILETNSYEKLVEIPQGFNNNIFWNIAHCVATQQIFFYKLSKNPFTIDTKWIEFYKKGTFPMAVSVQDIEEMKSLLIETHFSFIKDYKKQIFGNYIHYSTSFGIDLENIKDAIVMNNIHESMHYGYILAQRRIIYK